MLKYFKKILLIIFINFLDQSISSFLSNFYIIFPLTFLAYAFYVYRSDKNINPSEAFVIGLFIDLISESYFGLHALIFCVVTYIINIYANAFKLFSYLQICIFFGVLSTAYVGFTQLIINLYNFSYLILFISAIFNTTFCIFIAALRVFFPKTSKITI